MGTDNSSCSLSVFYLFPLPFFPACWLTVGFGKHWHILWYSCVWRETFGWWNRRHQFSAFGSENEKSKSMGLDFLFFIFWFLGFMSFLPVGLGPRRSKKQKKQKKIGGVLGFCSKKWECVGTKEGGNAKGDGKEVWFSTVALFVCFLVVQISWDAWEQVYMDACQQQQQWMIDTSSEDGV